MCRQWNLLITDCKVLYQRKASLDPYEQIKLVYTFGSQGTGKGQFNYPIGVCTLQDKIIVCDCGNYRIQVFNQGGEFVHMFPSTDSAEDQLGYTDGICIHNDNLWVADSRHGRIRIFNPLTGDCLDSITLEVYKPRGICSSRQGFVLATTEKEVILIVDENGSITKRFAPVGKDNEPLNWPRGICSNSRGEIVVADCDNNRVQVFSQEGKLLGRFGSPGIGPDQFYYPRAICVDWEDNIFVTDRGNGRISIFNRMGKPIQQIPFNRVLDVCLMGGKLVATSGDNTVGIFSN